MMTKIKRPLAVFGACLALAFAPVPFATAAEAPPLTGVIAGRVLNASNGQYLKNARIAIEGSSLTVLTNDYGEYQIAGVPAGAAKLRVSYPGLPAQQLTVTTAGGQTVRQDVELTAEGRSGGEPVVMDAFTVAARKETDGKTIAINEQRYAVDIKNVVAADEYGDVTEGNVGEFLKYIPGVLVDYNAAAARTISVRGLPPSTTPVSMDGNRMATLQAAQAEGARITSRALARFEPVAFDPMVVNLVEQQAQALGCSHQRMPSGAGHDAQMLARVCPSAMIFVPSVGGLSHNVREHTEPADLRRGAQVLLQVVLALANRPS
jgi:hypothetical protein